MEAAFIGCREEDAFAGDVGDGSQCSFDHGGGDAELETEFMESFGNEGKPRCVG